MLMIKNVLFCIAKAKIDDPDGEFWIILLGTDRLEELFGILRTMIGNDANLDVYQLVCRLAGTTEVSNILAKYPEWDRSPRRLRLPSLSRESKEIPYSADHIKPASWRGNVKVKDISLQTSWNRGRHLVEQDSDTIKSILQELELSEDVDILSPFGTLLFDTPLAEDDIDKSLEFPTPVHLSSESSNAEVAESDANIRMDVEEALEKLALSDEVLNFNKDITFKGTKTFKARALAQFSKDQKRRGPSSTDRLRRVQDVERYPKSKTVGDEQLPPAEETDVLFALDPISSLVQCKNKFWICIGEVTGIKVDGRSVPYVNSDMLGEDTVSLSYQLLGLRRATSDDDPEHQHDWRTYPVDEQSFTVPGCLVQPINPSISKTHKGLLPFYLLESAVLVALTANDVARRIPTNYVY
jgi:hypothetical protein